MSLGELPPWPSRSTLYVSPTIYEYLRKLDEEGKLSVRIVTTQKPPAPREEDGTMDAADMTWEASQAKPEWVAVDCGHPEGCGLWQFNEPPAPGMTLKCGRCGATVESDGS